MTLISVYLTKKGAIPFLFLSTLCWSIGWAKSRRQSSPFEMEGSVDPLFDVPSADFDPSSSMFAENAVPMYPPPRASGNRSPFGGSSPSFPVNSHPFGGSRSPFGNPPPFGAPGADMSPPWERSFNSMPGGGPLPSSPFGSRPRIGISSIGASPPKLNGGFTPPWQRGMPSRPNPASFSVDSNLMGIDDMGPSLGRRHRKIKEEKPSLFARGGMGGGDPEDLGMEPFRDDEGLNFGSPFPMMELPGYEEMLMGGRDMLQNRGRRTSPFSDDLGAGYVEDADEPFNGDSSPFGNPAGASLVKHAEKKHHRPRNQKYPEEEVYTGSGMSYGPYGYQDPDFDQSLIEELEMVDQQADQPEMEEGGPNDTLYATMDENNAKQFNQPLRNSPPSHVPRGDKNVKTTEKPQGQANSADTLEEEVVFGNVRRSVQNTPQDVLNKISSNAATATGNGNGTPSGRGPSEVINGLRSSPPKSKGFIRVGGGRVQNNGNNNRINMNRAQQSHQPRFMPGGRRPHMSASDEEESVIRGTFPSPGQLSPPGRNLYPGLDGYVMEPQRNRGMYPMNDLNRHRRNALAENYYGDTEAYPILRPLPVPITPKYLYGDQPVYTYDLPGLVFNRMKRQGGPQQYLVQPRQGGGVSRQGPRRVIRRIIRRRPLMQRQRRLRQQFLPQGVLTDEEEGSYENIGETEGVTPVVPQTNDTANNTNTTDTPTTTSTSTTTSTPVTTETPHEIVVSPKSEPIESKPVKVDHKRKRETALYNN